MKLVLFLAAVHAAVGAVSNLRAKPLAAHAPPGVLSLLQEEPSDITQNATAVSDAPDQINVVDEKAVPVATIADDSTKVEVATDADASEDASEDIADGETADAAAQRKAEDAEVQKDLPAAVEDEAADAEETANHKAAPAKPVFDVDQIERSLINLRKTEGGASPGMMAFVEKVTALIADMEVKVVDASKKDQSLLHDYRAAFTKCKKGSQTSRAAMRSMVKDKSTFASNHRSCRFMEKKAFQVRDRCDQLLVSKKETKEASCGALKDLNRNPVSEANNCHPAHSERFPIWLRRNEAWFRFKRREYQAALVKCQKATAAVKAQVVVCNKKTRNHITMKALCDVKQDKFEGTACGLGKEMSRTCHKYGNCYEDTKEEYEKAKPGIRNMERDRKGEWRVLKRVKCLLDVFAGKDGEVNAEVIGKCKEITHSTTHLNLFYPPIPPKLVCPAIPPVPGQNRFMQAFYSSLPFDAKAKNSETCIVNMGGGVVLGRPKGTTVDKCSVKGDWLVASKGGSCAISDERRRPVKVDFTKGKYTTYKFKMIFKGNPSNRNRNPIGGIRFCGGVHGRYLMYGDDPAPSRWGWAFKHWHWSYWARYTNKNDPLTGVKGKANPTGDKVMDMEVVLKRINSNVIALQAWKVNGVQLTRFNGHHICTGGSARSFVPEIYASPTTTGIQISDFRVYQGSNAVMAMPQIVGSGVSRTPLTVRCARRNTEAIGKAVQVAPVATSIECQELCAGVSGCVEFVFRSDKRCYALTTVTRRITRPRFISGPAACEQPYRTGLKAEFFWFNRAIHRMPNLAFRKPDQTRVDLSVKYFASNDWPGIRRKDRFVARWTGSLLIKNPGWYRFWTTSDDGSFLWIDGNQVVNNGGLHGTRGKEGRTHLAAGWHRIQAMFFENGGHQSMWLQYNGADTFFNTEYIPTEVLRPEDRASKNKRVSIFGTPDDQSWYKYPMQSRLLKKGDLTYLLFTVRASNDANILLYKDPIANFPFEKPPKGSYLIALGRDRNGRSAFELADVGKLDYPYTKNIISKDEYRKFYIVVDSKAREVRVGRGHDIEKYAFMKKPVPSFFEPKGFAVMSGWGSTAEWVFNLPQRKAKDKNRMGSTAWYLGDVGQDCTETCAKQGRVCDSDIRSGYSYSKFREFIKEDMGATCEKDNRAWWGQDQPCFVADGPDGNQGKCLASRNIPTQVRCSGKHPKVMRWCKCSASTNIFSVINVGKRTWNSMKALAETKGGRLMTLDEARLILKRRGMRAFVPNRDAWAAVTNEASTCPDKMDWIQIGNRGHWTGKSHFEFHGCPGWANQAKRHHWDSGYLLMAKERQPPAVKA